MGGDRSGWVGKGTLVGVSRSAFMEADYPG